MVGSRPPTAYVGITDRDWLDSLQAVSALDEVNFWEPSVHGFAVLPRIRPKWSCSELPANRLIDVARCRD